LPRICSWIQQFVDQSSFVSSPNWRHHYDSTNVSQKSFNATLMTINLLQIKVDILKLSSQAGLGLL